MKKNQPMPPINETTKETVGERLIVPIASIAIIVLLFILYLGAIQGIKTDTIAPPIAVAKENPFDDVKLSAKAAIVWDVKHHRALYTLNENTPLPLASLTKMMAAITATDLAPEYTVVLIQKEFLAEEGDSGLKENEKWRLKELLDFTLTASSNDGSRAIASVIGAVKNGSADYTAGRKSFIAYMNDKAKILGLTSMHFSNENGLDVDKTTGGAYGSVRDVALLFETALKKYPRILESTKESNLQVTSLDNVTHIAHNTNWIVDSIPGVVASKTGFTDLAQGNLAVVFDADLGRPIIISVLGSTQDGRFTDVEILVNATRKYLE